MHIQELIDAGNDLSDRLTCPCGGPEDPTCFKCLNAANKWEQAISRFKDMRQWPPLTKAQYTNALRKAVSTRCPKNKMNVPLVSDFDLLTADQNEVANALQAIQ